MGPSLDCAISDLLCDEGDDGPGSGSESAAAAVHPNRRRRILNFSELPVQSEECLALMIRRESEHLPSCDYLKKLKNGELDFAARDEVLDWIAKVHSHFNFGPLCAYLAVNYLDRFLSAYELPGSKNWMMQLLAVACLSLAAKMEETEVPLSLDLQVGDSKFVFEGRTIQRMELLVLSTLKWRMQAVTPFSFIDYYLKKVNGDQMASSSSVLKCTELILSTLKGINFIEFRSSEIAAAAVAISVAVETEAGDSERVISSLTHHIQKERVMRCMESMRELSSHSSFLTAQRTLLLSVPHSPIGVLDAGACLSYATDESGVGQCEDPLPNSPVTKRRKLEG
ncbi:hypothetical protein DM860_017097 [Cuscuta australis]|uniref:Uncharacterized protein n=2 Tax=Cuscuta sect. Cleistogrammica TaxID=1824901 RepID=A0A328DNK0_9ASTE|nr:hypothetical protein DM860_017097 [Cuscuta australis]